MACHGLIMATLWVPTVQHLEEWGHNATVGSASKLAQSRFDQLYSTARDYARWDDMYELMLTPPEDLPQKLARLAVPSDASQKLNVDIMLLINEERRVIFSSQAESLGISGEGLTSLSEVIQVDSPGDRAGLYLATPEKLLYLVSATVFSPSKSANSRAKVILGIEMNRFLVQEARISICSAACTLEESTENHYWISGDEQAPMQCPFDVSGMLHSKLSLPTFSHSDKNLGINIYTQQHMKRAFAQTAPYSFAGALTSWLILAIAVYLFVDRRLLRSFEELTLHAKRLHQAERLEAMRFPVYGRNEVGDLSRAFNHLLDRYSNANKSLADALESNKKSLANFESVYTDAQSKLLILNGREVIHMNHSAQTLFTKEQQAELVEQLLKPEGSSNQRVSNYGTDEVLMEHNDDAMPAAYAVRRSAIVWDGNSSTLVELTDITALRQLHEKSARTNRLEMLGQFSSGVAHDLNNILHGISAYTDLLRDTQGLTEDQIDRLNSLDEMTARGRGLVKQILGFVRTGSTERDLIDISDTVEKSLHFMRLLLPSRVNLQYASELDSKNWWLGSRDDMTQLLMNLLMNASDAMQKCGTVSVLLTTSTPLGVPERLCADDVRRVWLQVTDSGPGIKSDSLPKMFERFYTTKARSGYGIGLATVKELVDAYGAILHVSNLGGASFSIGFATQEVMDSEYCL